MLVDLSDLCCVPEIAFAKFLYFEKLRFYCLGPIADVATPEDNS